MPNNTDLSGPASGQTTVAALSFYDKKAEGLSVTCTATLTAPDGTSLSVSATAPQITVLKPTVSYWGIAEGYVQSKSGGNYGLYADPSGSYPEGMTWHDVAVSVPNPFSGGQCDFAQLTNPDREAYTGSSASPIGNDPKNGLIGLDGGFPYSSGGYGSGWSLPATGGNGDSPELIARGNPYSNTRLTATDAFTTWLIYMPPSNGLGTVWVPLQKYSWSWSEELTWASSQWSITAAYPWYAGAGPSFTPQNTDDPPQWNLIH